MNNSVSWFTLTIKFPYQDITAKLLLHLLILIIINISRRESSRGKGKKGPKGSSLPEGFFDDPKLDAKARKVEYKDPMTEEWDKFQKTIQKEDDVSDH